MPIANRLTIENVNLDDEREMDAFDDRAIAAGMERVRAEGDELRGEDPRSTGKCAGQRTPGRHAGNLGERLQRVDGRTPHVHRRRTAWRRQIVIIFTVQLRRSSLQRG